MRPVTFLFGIHNHQPVGNFDWVIEEAYQKAYRPFLDRLEAHPGVKVALHNSGILLDWFGKHHPEYLERVGSLVAAAQVEPITGGYYEPILPVIPDADKTGQIRRMSEWIDAHWGKRPTGLWLAERVWEPSLAVPIAEAGVRWLMVDDAHFLAAGAEPERLWNWWLTEDQGTTLGVWPISKALRYLIPFEPPEKTIEFLRNLAAGGADRVAFLADDGEKFGVWPDTFERVYTNGWLEKFFCLLEANADWLKMELPGAVTATRAPAGRIYLPTASYSEMMEWALPTPVQKEFHRVRERLEQARAPEAGFVRGGFWRNFLARYPESNLMHKRMLDARQRLDANGFSNETRALVLDDVWQAQCNCAYWHGVFGGLYLPHLREGVYRRILSAEARLDESGSAGLPFLRVEHSDLDRDGHDEIRMVNRGVGVIVSPFRGGAIESMDYYPRLRNLSHGLTRRPEAYHEALR
ncbi:MAG TPA: alpha-amylase/4-alpha-glucanotransferase domain-containing protein, partial [Candidatus Eisenbacteria bacterium]